MPEIMKKSILVALIGSGLFIIITGSSMGVPYHDPSVNNSNALINPQEKKETVVKTVYACPMHSEIVQEKAGKCPKCGMDLKAREVRSDVYICPMHPEVAQSKKGKCPKCGMDLALREPQKNLNKAKK